MGVSEFVWNFLKTFSLKQNQNSQKHILSELIALKLLHFLLQFSTSRLWLLCDMVIPNVAKLSYILFLFFLCFPAVYY